ncbi:MAG: rhomboid family intramembrane serine protease [Gemmatimonadales bacterium]
MFPYRDDNPAILTPVVTVGLIAANLAVWIVFQGMGADQRLAASVCELGLIPGDLLHRLPVGYSFSVGDGMSCVVESGQAWKTVITSMFLHGGWLHVLGNCWYLWVFGNNVEDAMGHLRFLGFYLLCGIAAAAAQIFADPGSAVPMVGASGAISGVMGAYVVLYPRVRVHTLVVLVVLFFRMTFPAWAVLGLWFLTQILNSRIEGQVGGVAVMAHIGGFLAGALLIFLFRSPALLERRARLLSTRTMEGFAR